MPLKITQMQLEHILYCTPLGQSVWRDFVCRLSAQTERQSAAETVVVLPSPYLLDQARSLLRDLDLEAWSPPLVRSLDQLAELVAGPAALDRIKFSRVSQEMLLDSLLQSLLQSGDLKWAAPISTKPGFIDALAALFDELKMAGVAPYELESAFDAISEGQEHRKQKQREITTLYQLHQDALKANRLLDVGEVYLLALEALEKNATVLPFKRVLLVEFSVLSPLRTEFLRRLKQVVSIEAIIQYEKNRTDVFGPVEATYADFVGMDFEPRFLQGGGTKNPGIDHLCRNIFGKGSVAQGSGNCVHIFFCPDSRKEMDVLADQVKKRLLAGECNPAEVAVVARDREYCREIVRYFEVRGVPVDAQETILLSDTSVALMLEALLSAATEGGSRTAVTALLKSGYVKDRLSVDPDEIEACCLGKVIRSWDEWKQAGDSWRDALGQLQGWTCRCLNATGIGSKAEVLDAFLFWIDVPNQLGCRYKTKDVSLPLGVLKSELQAVEKIRLILGELKAGAGLFQTSDSGDPGRRFDDLFRLAMQETQIAIRDRVPSGVQVVTPETASGMAFDTVFVIGLSDGVFPRMQRESWLLSDEERGLLRETGVLLTRSVSRRSIENLNFALTIGMARRHLFLCGVENEETLAASYVGEVSRLVDPENMMVRRYGAQEDQADDASEVFDRRALARLAILKSWPIGPERSFGSLFPAVWADKAWLESSRPPEYDGRIPPDWKKEVDIHSPSALETYANCPFVYFVEEVLRLRNWDMGEPGLDAMTSGLVWHETLADFLSRYRAEQLIPGNKQMYLSELAVVLETSVRRLESSGKIVLDSWWQVEQPRWMGALARWLDGEMARQENGASLPCFFEWSFGRATHRGCDPFSVAETLLLTDAPMSVNMQGKVDRIDRLSDENYRVIDYKTGKTPTVGQLKKGLLLQVPIYMMAVDQFLCKQEHLTAEGEYLSLLHSGRKTVLPGKEDRVSLLKEVKISVMNYVARIRSGDFMPAPIGACPSYCPELECCRFNRKLLEQPVAEDIADE